MSNYINADGASVPASPEITDGGPAYPVILKSQTDDGVRYYEALTGKSLRADFAGQMMVALITEPQWAGSSKAIVNLLGQDLTTASPPAPLQSIYAAVSVMLADALIEELQKVPA